MRRWVYMILIGNVHIVGKYKGNKGQGEGPSWSLGLARGETKLNCNSQYGWSGHGCKTVKGIYTTKKSVDWPEYQTWCPQLQMQTILTPFN